MGLVSGRRHDDYLKALLQATLLRIEDEKQFERVETGENEEARSLQEFLIVNWCTSAITVKESASRSAVILRIMLSILSADKIDRNGARQIDILLKPDISRGALLQVLKSIVDGPIDADKFDYLQRDGLHCGISYAVGIDADRFLESLVAVALPDGAGRALGALAVTDKGIHPLENIVCSRYQMFEVVYWHRTVRAFTAMFQRLIVEYVDMVQNKVAATEKLINLLRTEIDANVLGELKSRMLDSLGEYEINQRGLDSIIDSLNGERSGVFKCVLEVGKGDVSLDEWRVILNSLEQKVTQIASKFSGSTTVDAFVSLYNARGMKFSECLAEMLKKCGATGDLIDSGYLYSKTLLDLPESGKDQSEDVWIVQTTRGRSDLESRVLPASSSSLLLHEMSDAFKYWARRVRVFLAPTLIDALSKQGIGLAKIERASLWALREFAGVAQPELPFAEEISD
jgi:hypothetical protein